jgi:hypothetical protein
MIPFSISCLQYGRFENKKEVAALLKAITTSLTYS